ncbi:MAG: hypothetical protein J1E78_02460 [Muribaculaceae bacterium]|nr:hypothetical protein [Muribaculaceae bacterium]
MRILFIGDYSNLHSTLAKALRDSGHETYIISDRCGHMDVESDFYLKRMSGVRGGIKYLYDLFSLLPRLTGYDVVQLINTNFLNLRPGKIKYFFDRLKGENSTVFLTLAGNDYNFCKTCYEGKIFRYSEFKIGEDFTEFHKENPGVLYGWMSHANKMWSEYILYKIDGAMSVLPEYDMAARGLIGEKLTFTNLPIDLKSLPLPTFEVGYPVNITIGIRSGTELKKGTLKLLKLARKLEDSYPGKVIVDTFKDLSFKEYVKRISSSNIVLDQLYAYAPAMNALYAMALGKVAVTGGQKEYYDYLGWHDTKPVISISPSDNDIYERLLALVENKTEIIQRGKEGRRLVEKFNDSGIVADKFVKSWREKLA